MRRPNGGNGEDPRPGSVVAGHEIEAKLGRGGMGVVYRARHVALDRPRALKLIATELASDVLFRSRFERESRVAASVNHANVVAVHHAGEDAGGLFISMSLIEGPDLGALVAAEGALDPARVANLVSQIGAGLDAAHELGLVHRDVKPSNVMIEQGEGHEHAYVGDFGLSRLVEDDGGLTTPGDFMGSSDFVSPEQIEGDPVDRRADVYALGALAYFLLTGEAPFARRSAPAKLVAHVNAPRPLPSESGAPVPPSVDRAVARAMAVDPRGRFETAGAFAAALASAIGGEPGPESTAAPGRRLAKAITAGALVLAVAAAGLVLALSSGEDEPPEAKDDTSGAAGPTASPAAPRARASSPVRVGDGPTGITTGAGRVWVAVRDGESIESISPRGDRLDADAFSIEAGTRPVSVAVGFGSVWAVDVAAQSLVRIPLTGGAPAVRIPLGGEPSDVVLGDSAVWVTREGEDEVARIDPETNQIDGVVPVADGPRSVAHGAGGIWVACIEAGVVLEIDPEEARVVGKPIPAGTRPNDLAVGEAGVWVTDNLEGVVRLIDPAEGAVSGAPVEVGAKPRGITAGFGSVWIANSDDGTVTRVGEAERAPLGEPIAVGAGPADITAGLDAVWTADFEGGTVTRIEP